MPTAKGKPTVDEMLPPPGMEDVGGHDFKVIGQGIAENLQTLFRADEKLLDMGCGIGRVAIPLTQYLTDEGRYEGFDVMQSAIQYCTEKITPHYPNFRFTHSDIRNSRYNPNGKVEGKAYRFPYDDAWFDLASATSLFTHLLPDESARYLSEAARVLKPGGRILATFFLLDDEARALIKAQKASLYFPYEVAPSCWVASQEVPEAAVCFDVDYIKGLFHDAGLEIHGDVGWGTWTGRTVRWGGFQDQIVAIRR